MDQPAAIVTGAGRGIGRASAVALGAQGYRVVLVSRSETDLTAAARECGHDALTIAADLRTSGSHERIVGETMKRFGRIDALVNAAGVAPVLDVEATTADRWRDVIETNLSAPFLLARAIWPVFRERGGGVIVNVSSFSARDPFPKLTAYAASKGGLNLLGLAMAREGAPLGIRVHTIAPAAVETGMFRSILSHEQYPSERTLAPEEVARLIVQCVTGDLRHTSGEVIWLSRQP